MLKINIFFDLLGFFFIFAMLNLIKTFHIMKTLFYFSLASLFLVLLLTSAKPIHQLGLKSFEQNTVPVQQKVDNFNPQKYYERQCTFCHNNTGRIGPSITKVKIAYLKAYPQKKVFVEKMTKFIKNPVPQNRLIKNNAGRYKLMPSGMFSDDLKIKKVVEYIYNKIKVPKTFKKEKKGTTQKHVEKIVNKHVEVKIRLDKGTNICDILKLHSVDFEYAKFTVNTKMANQLNKLVVFLKENPKIKIEVRNHTDSRGSAKSNLILSNRRASAIRNYLVQHGISSTRISAKGFGEAQLLNYCKDGVKCSEEQHRQNRRTEIILL